MDNADLIQCTLVVAILAVYVLWAWIGDRGMNWTLEVVLCGLLVSAVMLTVSLVLYSLDYLAISKRKG
jgi:hypothetical protein